MAEKKCNNCGINSTPARAERHTKALIWVIVLLIVLLVCSNGAWLWYENQFEVVAETTTETYTIDQDAETGNNNSVINGGEVVNGKAND